MKDTFQSRHILYVMAMRDMKAQYMGSYLGFVWVFLQPLLFLVVLYSVFTFGLRHGAKTGAPFSVYLVTGYISWIFITQNILSMTNSIRQYSFVVKRVGFRLSLLPIVKLLSSLIPHFFFIALAVVVAWVNKITPSWYLFQVIYYLIAASVLLVGLGWITSALNVFAQDVSKLMSVVIQFGFWGTPIFWDINSISSNHQWLLKLNPAYYIVSGYRDSVIFKVPFWERPMETIYFWVFSLCLMLIGVVVFRKLRPYFAEAI